MTGESRIVIAVITFRRPQSLAVTLKSLSAIHLPPDTQVKLLVVDNDPGRSAVSVVEAARHDFPYPVTYTVEEKQGIPYARNAVLEHAVGDDYIAFIDDDDTADPYWLAALYAAAKAYSADVVKGRVAYTFPSGKEHLSRIDIFVDIPLATGTRLGSAWTNNVLFSTAIYRQNGLRFDAGFARIGGSDHHFFHCVNARGAKIVMCSEAIIYTHVPPERTQWRWLARRNLRVGATLTMSDIRVHGYRYGIVQGCRSFADSLRYLLRLMPGVYTGENRFIHPVLVFFFAFGRLAGILRISPQEYNM